MNCSSVCSALVLFAVACHAAPSPPDAGSAAATPSVQAPRARAMRDDFGGAGAWCSDLLARPMPPRLNRVQYAQCVSQGGAP